MEATNELYPVFLKVKVLHVLIVGGGNVGLEKLTFLLKSSPNAHVTVVAKEFHPNLIKLAMGKKVRLVEKPYSEADLRCKQIVIAATDSHEVNLEVYRHCKAKNTLVNVADTPQYCDFYMGGIVTKGHVKIAISTNGKSPTVAKRLRQYFEQVIPEDINVLLENLNQIRTNIAGGFEAKVKALNAYTSSLIEKPKF